MAKKRLYLIGIDSAALWIIEKLHRKYQMKGFEQFINDGKLGEMKTTLPPLTPVAWPSIYSGLEPREHGVMDFFSVDRNYTKQLLYFDSDAHETFWDALAKSGRRCLVVTPAEALKMSKQSNVDMVTGWPLPPKFSSGELEHYARESGFDGEPSIESDLQSGKMGVEEGSRRYREAIGKRSEFSKKLIEENDYDMAFICFTEVDRMQHYSLNNPKWEELNAPLYKGVSDFVEWTIAHAKEEGEEALVMIVSDHGAQPVHLKFLLNAWLINNGYAKLKPSVMKSIAKPGAKAEESGNIRYTVKEKIIKSKLKNAVYDRMLPKGAKRLARNVFGSVFATAGTGSYTRIHDFDLEMKETRAFTSVSNDPVGMIWMNDRRFASPTVQPGERAKLKSELIAQLKQIKNEKGERLVTAVYDGEEYYKNTKLFIAPDILIGMMDGYIADVKNYSQTDSLMAPELAKSGDHTENAVIGVLGINGAKAKVAQGYSVYDVKPTILDYFKK